MYSKRISTFTDSILPDFVSREHPEMALLLRKYLEYMERYNEVKVFNTIAIHNGQYDPQENGTIYNGVYIDLDYLESELDIVMSLNGTLIKGQTSNAIYKVEDIVYSIRDNKYLLKAVNSNNNFLSGTEDIAQVDIGEYTRINNLLLYRDIDTTIEEFLSFHSSEFLAGIPSNLSSDVRLLIKKIRDYYSSKGTEASYRFLFRSIWDSDVEFYFPRENILRASDGKWFQPIELVLDNNDDINLFINNSIQVINGDASAEVISVLTSSEGNITLEVDPTEGNIQVGDVITNETGEISRTITEIILSEGRWLNNDGKLSSDQVLQDNIFYQDFSYVLRSNVSINLFEDIIKEINHPAGFALFAEFVEDSEQVFCTNLFSFSSDITFNLLSAINEVNIIQELIPLDLRNDSESCFHITTNADIDINKLEHPWDNLYQPASQYDNVNIADIEDNPDEPSYLIPDSELTINESPYLLTEDGEILTTENNENLRR